MGRQAVTTFDTIVVGAGSAGALCAIQLAKAGQKVLLLDAGGSFDHNLCKRFVNQTYDPLLKEPYCKAHYCLAGVGGAALHFEANFDNYPFDDLPANQHKPFQFSSSLESAMGGHTLHYISRFYEYAFRAGLKKPERAIRQVKDLHSVDIRSSGTIPAPLSEVRKIAHFIEQDLIDSSVMFLTNRTVLKIEKEADFVVTTRQNTRSFSIIEGSPEEFHGRNIVIATGKRSTPFVFDLVHRFDLQYTFPDEIEVGFRVEMPSIVMDDLLKNDHNPRIKSSCGKHRTFCICQGGRLMKYYMVRDSKLFILDGQHAHTVKGHKTNFSILSKVLVPPVTTSFDYAMGFVRDMNALAPDYVPVQIMSDYLQRIRSSPDAIAQLAPTMDGVVCHDMNPVARKYGIEIDWFVNFIKDFSTDPEFVFRQTILIAPSVEKYNPKIILDGAHSSIEGLYFAGDSSGCVSGISSAGAMGLLAADQILSKSF